MVIVYWSVVALVIIGFAVAILIRQRASRIALRAVHRSGARIDRFKLTRKPFIRETLLADPAIVDAVKEHATEQNVSEAETWDRVEAYIDEIVPSLNIPPYDNRVPVASRMLLIFFNRVPAEDGGSPARLPKDWVGIYRMNHRSSADYVLVGCGLWGEAA